MSNIYKLKPHPCPYILSLCVVVPRPSSDASTLPRPWQVLRTAAVTEVRTEWYYYAVRTVSIFSGEYDLPVVVERGLGDGVQIHGHPLAVQRLQVRAALAAVDLMNK